MEYNAPKELNATPSGITDIVRTNRSVKDDITQVGYQAGVGAEVVLSKPEKPGGIIFFLKAGTSRPFSRKSFDFDGFRYNPQLNYGDWMAGAGIKFFGR